MQQQPILSFMLWCTCWLRHCSLQHMLFATSTNKSILGLCCDVSHRIQRSDDYDYTILGMRYCSSHIRRLSPYCRLGAERRVCHVRRQNKHLRWPILRCRRSAHMERAAVQPTRHWDIADYFQRTFENILILRRVLRSRRICDIYDVFAPFINLLTYLLINVVLNNVQ